MNQNMQLAIISSATPQAREAEALLREVHEFVPLDSADAVIVLGGDGHMLQVLLGKQLSQTFVFPLQHFKAL